MKKVGEAERESGTLGDTRVDDLVRSCDREVDAGFFPTAKVGE